jgi:hypothetical protein
MGHKRHPSAHQKQVRFFLFFFGALMVIAVVAIIVLINRPWAPQ